MATQNKEMFDMFVIFAIIGILAFFFVQRRSQSSAPKGARGASRRRL